MAKGRSGAAHRRRSNTRVGQARRVKEYRALKNRERQMPDPVVADKPTIAMTQPSAKSVENRERMRRLSPTPRQRRYLYRLEEAFADEGEPHIECANRLIAAIRIDTLSARVKALPEDDPRREIIKAQRYHQRLRGSLDAQIARNKSHSHNGYSPRPLNEKRRSNDA